MRCSFPTNRSDLNPRARARQSIALCCPRENRYGSRPMRALGCRAVPRSVIDPPLLDELNARARQQTSLRSSRPSLVVAQAPPHHACALRLVQRDVRRRHSGLRSGLYLRPELRMWRWKAFWRQTLLPGRRQKVEFEQTI